MIAHSKPWMHKEDYIFVEEVFRSGMIAEGRVVSEFENAVSLYLGMAGGVATSNGTSALFLALKSLGIESGEVLCPTYVCRAVWDAIHWAGAQPVLYDVGENWCGTAGTMKERLSLQQYPRQK
jgi:perosamine synthetase